MGKAKSTTKTAPTPGLQVTTDASGKITGAKDAAGSYSVDQKTGAVVALAPAVSPVTSSDPARDKYGSILDGINKLNNSKVPLAISYGGQTYNDVAGLVGAQRTSLGNRRAAEIAGINTRYDQQAAGLAQSQRGETGTASMGLARIGGFDSASGQAALTNLQRVHTEEQNALTAQREASLLQANNAYEDKDFALAQLQLDEARKSEQQLYDRQKDFINLSLQLRGEQRADAASELQQAQFEYQKKRDDKQDAQTALEFSMKYGIEDPFFVVGGVGYDTSTGDKLSYEDYIARGGKPDFSNAYVIKPGTLEDKAFVQDLRANYPDAGITSADSAEQATAKIKNSRIYRKETYIAPVGGGGGGISGAKTAKQADVIQRARAALAAEAAGSQDGKANPNTYRNFISEYIQADGSANDFYGAVSLDQFISDVNRKGDLAGTSIQYQQQKAAGNPQRLQELEAKSNGGQDFSKLTTSELAEYMQLLGL